MARDCSVDPSRQGNDLVRAVPLYGHVSDPKMGTRGRISSQNVGNLLQLRPQAVHCH